VWEWEDYAWQRYDEQISDALEQTFHQSKTAQVELRINYTAYTIDLGKLTQKNRRTGVTRKIRRIEDLTEKERLQREENAMIEAFKSKNEDTLRALFDQYVDDEDEIQDDGTMKFCQELGIDPEDAVILVISWHMQATTM
jgi:phosphoglycerate-specific signal transduction histidine kinase